MSAIIPTVPNEDDIDLKKLLDKLNATHEPLYVDLKPDPNSQPSDCFRTVADKVSKDGGKIIYGWQIWKTDDLIEAECHAVWEDLNEDLLDVTPKDFDTDKILFVEDENVKYEGKQVDNVRLNISKNPLADDLITVGIRLFKIMNKGNRASQYEVALIGDELDRYNNLQSTKAIITNLLFQGGNRNSLCLCGSNRLFKNCHGGKNLK